MVTCFIEGATLKGHIRSYYLDGSLKILHATQTVHDLEDSFH